MCHEVQAMSGYVKMLWGERRGHGTFGAVQRLRRSSPMSQQPCHFEASRSLIAVIEMSQSKWLVAALVPGIGRHPLKKLDAREEGLLTLLHRWRNEAGQAGREIKRVAVAYEAGRDGFWLARWLRARDVEVYVIHPTSIAVSREHRRAK